MLNNVPDKPNKCGAACAMFVPNGLFPLLKTSFAAHGRLSDRVNFASLLECGGITRPSICTLKQKEQQKTEVPFHLQPNLNTVRFATWLG